MTLSTATTQYPSVVRKAYQAFFSPARYEVKASEREILESGETLRVPAANGELVVTVWGAAGPTVLLMHGWGGARAQMVGLVSPLLQAGYRVVAYDQPAHGDSDGHMTNVLEIAPTLQTVAEQTGPFEVILAHSFGTIITSYAIAKLGFPAPAKLVYFGAFNRLMDSFPRFQALARLPDAVMDGMRQMLYENFGQATLDAIVNADLAAQIHRPALMFHDTADAVTPLEDSRAIARAWPHAHLVETTGLGHRGALSSQEIHEQVVKFLQS